MQRNTLYHSYTYLGQTFEDDELRHWKYISKEKTVDGFIHIKMINMKIPNRV